MISVGIVGATGYTGVELLRLLADHPEVQIRAVTSRGDAGTPVAGMFPSLRGRVDLDFVDPAQARLDECDAVFFATPHGVAHAMAGPLLDAGVRVIDLSADFRLRDAELWARWYGQPHGAPQWLGEAVYGLPELNRERIRSARLLAVPGCYPTAVSLGLLPLLQAGAIDPDDIIADAKSGVSGAGRKAQVGGLFAEVGENFKAYASAGHRHWPEIRQTLDEVAGRPVGLVFQPHLVPMIRGIHATLYLRPAGGATDFQALFDAFYRDEPFVDVLAPGAHPETASVRGTNVCRIALAQPVESGRLVVLSVIDNLVKGASGQAVQGMNLMFGFPEGTGLGAAPVFP
ncbi:N-acetyl-gamma-glutamyl-phosphate reductase [Thioalkalivibrio paradoxus]|uniref:N-acetyl-gamma-glutamyl-phosphate reductase n=1 Tax=Thioalkalivibrio paradoxus ARh 1 TaxID=713585 RepID=W0DK24_9GAMM|nr:N-acetyl-gamma-glutamyl-phosphate reductase [Thioalkalivibrio paradoxus]AHE97338.1 N-acetyl-gamma-glutamyl-phosphate reductase [Thioalkalivibrio paradoxus ARh 1]